jgi:hypothetical protein
MRAEKLAICNEKALGLGIQFKSLNGTQTAQSRSAHVANQ